MNTQELEHGITRCLAALDLPDQPAEYYRAWAAELRRLTSALVASCRVRVNTQKVLRCLVGLAA